MQNRLKTRGILMLVSFFAILIVIFSPVFPGKTNGLDYMDNLFNMVSKGSSYFIPEAIKDSAKYAGNTIDVTIKMTDDDQAIQTAGLFETSGAQVAISGPELTIKGDISKIRNNSLADTDFMFKNDGEQIAQKYGYPERQVLFNWWTAFKAINTSLNTQEKFTEAKAFADIQKRAIEPAYNYYGVNAMNWQDNIGLIILALAFYVIYTLWYGFGLMYLFEGLGLKIGH
jgi:hypothetical protein